MPRVRGLEELQRKLQALAVRFGDAKGARVRYTAKYAMPVHERRDIHHRVGKAGFLLDPFRANRPEYMRIITVLMQRGATFPQAAYIAALKLQRDSQQECPVLTGNLRASALTELVE